MCVAVFSEVWSIQVRTVGGSRFDAVLVLPHELSSLVESSVVEASVIVFDGSVRGRGILPALPKVHFFHGIS
jgi:hypothetical protein